MDNCPFPAPVFVPLQIILHVTSIRKYSILNKMAFLFPNYPILNKTAFLFPNYPILNKTASLFPKYRF